MATAKPEPANEDILTCTVCCNVYEDPCTLNCQHTFCRKCITSYLKSHSEAVKKEVIPCPSCRQITNVPCPTKPVEEWSDTIEVSFAIQALICAVNVGNNQTESAEPCSLCLKIEETSPGVKWCLECEVNLCDRCAKLHRHQPATQDHGLCDLADKGKVKTKRTIMCKEHTDEQIKLYCKDCNKALCHSCAVVDHRKCEAVVTIQSMMPKMKKDISVIRNKITERELGQRNLVERGRCAVDHMQNEQNSLKGDIQAATQRVIERAKMKEKLLLDQVDAVSDKHKKQLQAAMKARDIDRQMYRQHGEYIKQILGSNCEMDIYYLFQICQSGHFDAKTAEICDGTVKSVTFDYEKGILRDINLKYSVCDPLCTPVLHSTTDGRTDGDKEKPEICHITVLVLDGLQTIVATDIRNKCVKSFYRRNKRSLNTKLCLNEAPYGITKLKENQVMVCLGDSRQIVTIAVNPELQLLSTITTNNRYESLAVLGTSSLVAGRCDDYVDILDMEGQVMKSVSKCSGVKVIEYPEYIAVNNNGKVLVSDWGLETVICVSPNGDVVWTYPPSGDKALGSPTGITITSLGQVLFADRGSNKVILLTETGEYIRDVLTAKDGISGPCGIALDGHGSLFVCDGREVKEFIFL